MQNFTGTRRLAKLQRLTRSYTHLPVGHQENRSEDMRIVAARPRNVGHPGLTGLAGGAPGKSFHTNTHTHEWRLLNGGVNNSYYYLIDLSLIYCNVSNRLTGCF